MITELMETDLPDVYDRFVGLFQGGKPWLKAVEKLQLQLKANPYSQFQTRRENRIAYGLALYDAGGLDSQDDEGWSDVQHAMQFAAQICGVVDQAKGTVGQGAYIKRIHGAFANPAELRAIRFELLTAVTLYRQGAIIHWPEISGGSERFDILASVAGGVALEVECKSCSPDKGRAITEKSAAQFYPIMLRRLEAIATPGETTLLKITIPKRLPTATQELEGLAEEVTAAILAGTDLAGSDGVKIDIRRYVTPLLPAGSDPMSINYVVNVKASEDFDGVQGHRVINYCPTTLRAICVEVCSEQETGFFDAAWDTAKHAIQKQMTRTRPGVLVLRLEGMDKDALEQFSQEVPNPLAWFATKVLSDERHQHLACVAFISDETTSHTSPTELTTQSMTYVFDRPEGAYSELKIGKILLGKNSIETTTGKAPSQ